MTTLNIPDKNFVTEDLQEIKKILSEYHVEFERWEASFPLKDSDDQETILKAYEEPLQKYMSANGFQSADVINVHKDTPNVEAIREKFISEHTHSEDEVRFFVDGAGVFWFNFDDGLVVSLVCKKGDFLAVPKGYKHWFDLAPYYHVKAIRVFSNMDGWVANYTNSGVDARYGN